ncbi:MAG: SAM-dependent chlorinase/fluorinase [Nitrospirae bacterium]|nr:SAM-dependent chlorinase/fluorinase [Candidatus Manganitrophaceae bacterium]
MPDKKKRAPHSAIRNPNSEISSAAPTITLTTDFGSSDYFVGSVKGVLLRHDPSLRLVDITHEIAPQDLISAAFILKEISLYFPAKTVHLAVVDPGVGTDRRRLIAAERDQLYVAPDNGLLTYILQRVGCRVFSVEEAHLPLKKSPTFAGRDQFAPIAARLAAGVSQERLGRKIDDPVLMNGLSPRREGTQVVGKIVYFDRFGNAITNLTADHLDRTADPDALLLRLKGKRLAGLKRHYAEGKRGAGNLIINSSGHLELFVPGGSARDLLKLHLLDEVFVEAQKPVH